MFIRTALIVLLLAFLPSGAIADEPMAMLEALDAYPHAVRVSHSVETVADYEVALGAIRKVRGAWSLKHSERQSGELTRYTWQIIGGFTSAEILEELEAGLTDSALLFSCEGRSCGQGVQWANRVFSERVLYGRDDLQRYRVYGPVGEAVNDYRLLLFSAARTADRQYLHAELLAIGD